MTEVADLLQTDQKIISERKYDAGPPIGLELIEPGEAIATTKEEEWVSKKKTEVINTKQIETRVKRQVVLEDGKVVEDSGPVVTTNTTQDTETQEHHQTELRKLGEDDEENHPALKDVDQLDNNSKWVVVPNPDGVVREVKERRVVSREEKEEVKETEDIQHLGDITDEDYLAAVKTGEQDLRRVLRTIDKSGTISTGPRLIRDTNKSKKVTDTEETRQLSSIREDGRIVTETERTTEHEELKDDELPHDAPDKDVHLENSQRYFKSRDQEQVDYISNGVKIGEEMRYKGETIEVERHGNGIDEPDFDSLSARARRRNLNRPPRRYRDLLPSASPMDRKDALTRRPLDFDQEEETRKMETSKWLENHFGSESRSSRDSLAEEDEQPPKTSYFNVTIKSQPTAKQEPASSVDYVRKEGPRLLHDPASPMSSRLQEPERDPPRRYYQGITEWAERRHQENYATEPRRFSPSREYQRSPVPDYRISPERRISPFRETTPTPPQRKKALERRQRVSQESRYDSGYRTPSRNDTKESREEPLEEPPPDYSPPSPPTMPEKKFQKTRFAAEPTKHKSGNIIGQSIRKLVGKIRSASAERKAKQRAKRSPSPSYQKGHVIDKDINHHDIDRRRTSSPVHRYYLGEDPFGGSIYGRENKYDGVRPVRTSRRLKEEENRSQSTLGRFSKSTGRLVSTPRVSQTLPRHASKKEDNTINVSIINTQRPIINGGPAKPARTYKSNLSRSQSFNVQPGDLNARRAMHKSNPQLNRLDEVPAGLKSPALISSINRSQQNLTESVEETYTSNRYERNNGYNQDSNKRMFMKNLKDRAPELFKTLHDNNEDNYNNRRGYDIYEPPTRLRDTGLNTGVVNTGLPSTGSTGRVIRRGSTSSNDYSETYHTTSRNDDPKNPSITNTVQSFSKKTIPSRDGRSLETIESTEKKSITKSHYVGPSTTNKYYEDRKYTSSPVVIEVRNYRK
nr:uncharacterized protein LOC111426154 isoform X2 [Onthophagus taurus]